MKLAKTFSSGAAVVAALLAAVSLFGSSSPSAGSAAMPDHNLIIVVIDSLRADHLGAYGYKRAASPNMDRMASEGVVFERARSNSSFTRQAVATLLSGQLPSCVNAVGWNAAPRNAQLYLPSSLQRRGFSTALVATTVMLGGPFLDGFEYRNRFAGSWDESGHSSEAVARSLDIIKKQKSDSKFFLYLHLLDPHAPYETGKEFRAGFNVPVPTKELSLYGDVRNNVSALQASGFGPGSTEFEDLVARYDAEIAEVDVAIGELRAGLEKLGLGKNTLIVLTSDHGEEFLEHDFVEHAWTLYEESIRVPLIFWAPGALAPKRDARPVSHLDVVPTVLHSLFGVEDWSAFLGQPMFFADTPKKSRAYIGELLLGNRTIIRTVIDDGWKYHSAQKWLTPLEREMLVQEDGARGTVSFPLWSPAKREELFHLRADPGERANRLEQHSDLASTFRGRIETLRKRCPGPEGPMVDSVEELSEEEREALRNLGYIH